MDDAKRINIRRFRWLGHVVRMYEDAPPRRDEFDVVIGGHRRARQPRTRWKDQVEEALTSNGVTNWLYFLGVILDKKLLWNENSLDRS